MKGVEFNTDPSAGTQTGEAASVHQIKTSLNI